MGDTTQALAQLRPLVGTQSIEAALLDSMREEIATLRLPPGERLGIEAVARAYRVSHLPVRQVLRVLESEGLVVSRPRHGSRVAPLTAQDAEVVFTVAAGVEPRLIGLGVPRLTDADVRSVMALLAARTAAFERGDATGGIGAAFELRSLIMSRAQRPELLEFAQGWHRRQLRYYLALALAPGAQDDATLEEVFQATFQQIPSRDGERAARGTAQLFARLVEVCAAEFPDVDSQV